MILHVAHMAQMGKTHRGIAVRQNHELHRLWETLHATNLSHVCSENARDGTWRPGARWPCRDLNTDFGKVGQMYPILWVWFKFCPLVQIPFDNLEPAKICTFPHKHWMLHFYHILISNTLYCFLLIVGGCMFLDKCSQALPLGASFGLRPLVKKKLLQLITSRSGQRHNFPQHFSSTFKT